MNSGIRILLFGVLLVLIDLYFYQSIKTVLANISAFKKNFAFTSYWSFTVFSILLFLTPSLFTFSDFPKFVRIYVFSFVVMIIISKLIGSFFIALDDIIRFFRWVSSYILKPSEVVTNSVAVNSHSISRLRFLNVIAVTMAAIPFSSFIYGMVKGAFDYKIHKVKVVLPNLPSEFNGLKIVQISDIHSGSFVSTSPLETAVKMIQEQNADIIFFTGDLVNNESKEMNPFMEVLSKITAPMGVFSTLGNHDYGDYVTWESQLAKEKNLQDLKDIHSKLGWKLMMNEHVSLKKGESEIVLIGIENWGGNLNFPKYGDMKKAYTGTEKYPVKLLLSHDPSHWNLQVTEEFKDVDITFSGHTHGFQFGIEIPGLIKWSPSQFVYKQWAGLYSKNDQYLYVNRGLGFLGYPGRVGIMPEITVMELFNA